MQQGIVSPKTRGDAARRAGAGRIGLMGIQGHHQASVHGFLAIFCGRQSLSDRRDRGFLVGPGFLGPQQRAKVERFVETVATRTALQTCEHAHQLGPIALEGPRATGRGYPPHDAHVGTTNFRGTKDKQRHTGSIHDAVIRQLYP